MNILLVNPPTLYRGKNITQLGKSNLELATTPYYDRLLSFDESKRNGFSTLPGEHLGLQSLQASLKQSNHTVNVLNACVERHETLYQTLQRINSFDFELIGFSGPLDVFAENLWLMRSLRDMGFSGHITLGHDFATLNHQTLLQVFPEISSIVRGEGEVTLVELASALESGDDLSIVKGLSYRSGDNIIVNVSRPVINDLDILPNVTRYDLKHVLKLNMSASIYTQRGCPYQCSFCTTGMVPIAEGLKGRLRWRQRSAKRVVDEIQELVLEYGISSITIVDDLYLSKGDVGTEQAQAIAEELLDRHINIEYMIDCRVDSIDRGIFQLMKKSGLRKVFIGVESASETALETFNKGYKPSVIREKLRILEELGIEYILGFIMFNPLETLDGLEQSHRLISELDHHDFGLFLQSVRIYPGTHLSHQLKQLNLLTGEFPFFSSNYSDEFVADIRQILGEIGHLSVPIVHLAYLEGSGKAATLKRKIFELIAQFLPELIVCGKMHDREGIRTIHSAMLNIMRDLSNL